MSQWWSFPESRGEAAPVGSGGLLLSAFRPHLLLILTHLCYSGSDLYPSLSCSVYSQQQNVTNQSDCFELAPWAIRLPYQRPVCWSMTVRRVTLTQTQHRKESKDPGLVPGVPIVFAICFYFCRAPCTDSSIRGSFHSPHGQICERRGGDALHEDREDRVCGHCPHVAPTRETELQGDSSNFNRNALTWFLFISSRCTFF